MSHVGVSFYTKDASYTNIRATNNGPFGFCTEVYFSVIPEAMSVLFGLWNEGKGWGSKGHELFPVIFTMAGRKGKFAWGFKTVDARNGGLERKRGSRARVNAQRGRRVCGGMIWRLSNGITGKRFRHGSLSSTTVRLEISCLKLLQALLKQDHHTEGYFNMIIFLY